MYTQFQQHFDIEKSKQLCRKFVLLIQLETRQES